MSWKMTIEDGCPTPDFAHDGDAGMDLRSKENVTIPPRGQALVKTGIRISIPNNYVAQVCSRSGLALKEGVFVLNAPGIIDSGYRGEVGVILFNTTIHPYEVSVGDKVAQLVVQEVMIPLWQVVEELDETSRGEGGFGSSGKA